MDLKNKVAIVTGGGSGLGEATAIKLAEGGTKVAVLDLNGDAANAVAERIGGRAFAIGIADAVAGETTVATIVSDLGTPRILVNCAGVGTPMKILGKDGPVSLAALEKFWQEPCGLIQWWADELDRLREHGRVIKMSARGKARSKWGCSLKSHVH